MSRFKFDQSVPDADISKVLPVNGTSDPDTSIYVAIAIRPAGVEGWSAIARHFHFMAPLMAPL
jgi:hypothetical protein